MDKVTITIDAVTLETIRMGLGALQLQAQAAQVNLNAQVQAAIAQAAAIDEANRKLKENDNHKD